MTNAACKTYCTSLGFAYSGTEYSSECYCGNTLPTVASSSCNMACSASGSTEICGGPNALSVSTNSAIVASNAVAASWFNQGCYSDNYPSRVLASTSTTSSTLTIEKCITFCNGAGYILAGLENGYECYCASTVQSDGSTYGVAGQSGCTFTCSGNSAQACGGNNVLNLWSKNSGAPSVAAAAAPVPASANGYTYVACYSDQTSAGRTLAVNKSTIASVEACITACSTASFKFAGVENRNECWCDNVLRSSTTLPAKNCLLPCTGTPSESCGGINAIGIYQGTASSSVRIPTTAGGKTYLDSYIDSASARLLSIQQNLASNNVGDCNRACSNGGYQYAGVEYGSQCFCGSSLPGSPMGGQTPNMLCTGNSSQFCGGNNILQVYSGSPAPTVLTAPVTNSQCVADNTNNVRTLSTFIGASSSMTPAACKTSCVGFVYYGVEYGSECWCGNSFPSSTVVSTQCTMPCSGDGAQVCGGSYALNMYNS
ncbi:WSC-domain-containing protein [Cadophora sp. DSE1049]|nr:WSC-domain-containing protein [Cadophora sp. DSE1049]